MNRALAIGFGLLQLVAPRRIIEPGERLAFENPDAGRLRAWTVPMARLEALLFLWLLGRDDESLAELRVPLGVFGVAMALAPGAALAFGLESAYENPDDLEVKSWVVPATRLLGAVYLSLGLFAATADAPTDDGASGLDAGLGAQ
ncbi:hypothetical protein [Natrinema salifodinae]|uniref:Uncharacterized protein n=1 Tax=Natrinema salifodinae TaxID=1202768 RepID=A0A1I0QFJ5_9EURY|nr:hypothetical protein [Natrinema salifodinae]SEW25865.1 hypothetical protein SAMN05216285_3507 [Natrinema salifodinae]